MKGRQNSETQSWKMRPGQGPVTEWSRAHFVHLTGLQDLGQTPRPFRGRPDRGRRSVAETPGLIVAVCNVTQEATRVVTLGTHGTMTVLVVSRARFARKN